MFSGRRIWASLCILPGLITTVEAGSSPPVKVKLASSWPSPPLLVEFLETAALEKPERYFELVDAITDPDRGLSFIGTTDQALHEAVFQLAKEAGFLIETGSEHATRRALALHVASPKVEAFYHYYRERDWPPPPESFTENDCISWVDWYGQRICDVGTLRQLVTVETIEPANETAEPAIQVSAPDILPFDHINPPPGKYLVPPSKTAVLYTDLKSGNFRELHSYLYQESLDPNPRLKYILRLRPSQSPNGSKMPLSGYATVLDLKKTEYLAQDDRRRSDQAIISDEEQEQQESEDDRVRVLLDGLPLFEQKDLVSPLDAEEIPMLGYQATQLVLNSSDPLSTLVDLTNNFPKHMISMARRINVTDGLVEESMANEAQIAPGANIMWINGGILQENDANPFGLLRAMRKEREIMESLMALGLKTADAIGVLTHQAIMNAHESRPTLENLFDASDRAEGGNVIVWWNDLEADSRYSKWPSSLAALLRPTFPGQPYTLKRNLHNAVFIPDLSQRSGLSVCVQIFSIIMRNFPLRCGVVPWAGSEDALKAANLFYFLIENYGRTRTMDIYKQLIEINSPSIDWKVAENLYDALVTEHLSNSADPAPSFASVLAGVTDEAKARVNGVNEYLDRLGLSKIVEGFGHSFINGRYNVLAPNTFTAMQYEMFAQTEVLQEALFKGELEDSEEIDMSTYFYDLPNTLKRRNKYIYPAAGETLRINPLPTVYSEANLSVVSTSSYTYSDGNEDAPISISVVGDMDTEIAVSLFEQLLAGMSEPNCMYRTSFIHVPTLPRTQGNIPFSSVTLHKLQLEGELGSGPLAKLVALVDSLRTLLQSSASLGEAQRHIRIWDMPTLELEREMQTESYRKALESGERLSRNLGLKSGGPYLMVNGRLIGPLEEGSFVARDFSALAEFEMKKRVSPAISGLHDASLLSDLSRNVKSDLIAAVSSIVSAAHIPDAAEQGILHRPHSPRNRFYTGLESNHTAFTLGNNETALFHVGVVLDPLSDIARRWINLIQWLSGIDGVHIHVQLTPMAAAQIPLKSFYRYHLLSEIKFGEEGSEEMIPNIFEDLPPEPIYTLAMETLTSWLVRPNESVHDLDNIHLASLSATERSIGVEASFRLDYLVVEGHSRDTGTNAPTAGLQLQLTDYKGAIVADTMVVANLGYLQLKAPHPGSFNLEIREGRGSEVYRMESAGNAGFFSRNVSETGNQISLTSLEGLILFPRFHKAPGMEREDVLMPSRKQKAPDDVKSTLTDMYSKVSSLFWGDREKNQTDEVETATQPAAKLADINVFTVASGHLYERLSSIMMLSVLRNTKKTVKFWFIENFLSPSFLEFIPHFAKEYGFEYELVTYKWPSWLRAQKEKQRIIWAYKILFLDVLFPMDLKKVIFVDADQIMRADLQELVDLDLQGAPYGYTPMGDDNIEMEGFRFWKTGYWQEFLRGMPYHISALYVVDLERFRQIAAGDRLRGHYQQLSADPHSLSNLDQDLPNNMQFEIPIYSLHEDWLWCETWCSMERFERAKSIDLCFNPLTKEPKLVRARKTPGWTEYDNEIAAFSKRLVEEGLLHSALAAADTAALAQAGSEKKEDEREASSEAREETPVLVEQNDRDDHIRDEL